MNHPCLLAAGLPSLRDALPELASGRHSLARGLRAVGDGDAIRLGRSPSRRQRPAAALLAVRAKQGCGKRLDRGSVLWLLPRADWVRGLVERRSSRAEGCPCRWNGEQGAGLCARAGRRATWGRGSARRPDGLAPVAEGRQPSSPTLIRVGASSGRSARPPRQLRSSAAYPSLVGHGPRSYLHRDIERCRRDVGSRHARRCESCWSVRSNDRSSDAARLSDHSRNLLAAVVADAHAVGGI